MPLITKIKITYSLHHRQDPEKKQHALFYIIHTHTQVPRWRCSRLEGSPRMPKVGCSNSGRDKPRLLKQILTAPLLNNRQQVWVSQVISDDHYNRISPSVGVCTWHVTESSLLNGHEGWLQVKICSERLH